MSRTKVTGSQVTGVTESDLALADNTVADVSTSQHGFVPKAPGGTNYFLKGNGTWGLAKRVVTVTQSATPAINTDLTDIASITGLVQAITSMTTNLSGTPNDGDTLIIRITDDGTARAITWGAKFESSTISLPNTTVISTMLIVGFIWNTATSKWRCVAVA